MRRYREFDAFVSKLRKVVPALDREEFDLPPKVFFNKMAEKVVNSRLPALNSFLNATIQNCKTYGTAEQDVIFTFLDAYTNIISFVCSNDAHRNSLESHAMASVVGTVLSDVKNAKEGVAIEKRDWQTHFVAAAITAWLLMLSLGMA